VACAALGLLSIASMAACPEPPLAAAGPARFCVTLGEVEPSPSGGLRIDGPKVRAVTAGDPSRGELRFVYHGPTAVTAPLASGDVRRQIGLKLRAESGCNLLYVMWRLEPEARLVVSTKRNPGQRLHAECGTHGYTNLEAARSAPLPAVAAESAHVLRASLVGERLTVEADGRVVWEGKVSAGAVPAGGAVGFRTDNVRAEVEMRVARGGEGGGCAKGEE
jgi:hypothetical protein